MFGLLKFGGFELLMACAEPDSQNGGVAFMSLSVSSSSLDINSLGYFHTQVWVIYFWSFVQELCDGE